MKKSLCHPTVTLPFSLLFYILWISHSVYAMDPHGNTASDSVAVDTTLGEYYSRWSLEENAWDSKGSNHGLVIGDPVFVNKDVMENDFALSFDGLDDHVAISDDPSLEGMDQFCFSFWVKPDEHPSGPVMIMGKEMAYRVLLTPQGGYSWVIATENNPWYSPGTPLSGPGILAEGEWNHVVAGYDGGHSYLYLNGQLDAKSTLLTGNIVDNALPLTFAKGNDTNVGFFDGTLDDVRYYRIMLSDSSVQRLYNLYPLTDTITAPPEDTISGVQWRVTEIDFSSMKAYTNNFYDVDLDVVFTHSDGTTFTVPAFWNGGNQWKVRFAPTLTGDWSYQTICSDETNTSLHALTDTFSCEPYTGDQALYQHGFVKTTPDKRYFTYADDTPFFYLGDTHWNIPANSYENFKTIIDKRVEQKFTVIQSEPLGTGYTLWDGFSESDLLGFARLDERFKYVAEKGLVHTNAQLFFVSELGHKWDSYTDTYLEKLCRYWVARYSAYPVMWTTAQECDNDFYVERDVHDWWDVNTNPWKTVANYMHHYDPYKHPQTAHMEATSYTLASQSSFRDLPGHSWFAAQWSPIKNGQLNFSIPRDFWNNGQDKPIVNYEGHYDHLWTNHFGARMQGWTAFLNGMCGHGYGAIDIWLYNSTYNMDEPSVVYGITISVEDKQTKWDESLEFPSAYQMGYMHAFFQSIAWWKLTPRFYDRNWFSNDGSWYSLASIDNDLYVAYFYNVSPFVTSRETGVLKNLDDGDVYRAQWYNPREGSYMLISSSIQSSGGQWIIPEKPDTLDWVLLLTNDWGHLSNKMLGRWRLESNAQDELGSNHGTIVGNAAYSDTETREGEYSLVLDGTDDYLKIPDHPVMNDLNSFCIAFWMRSYDIPADSLIILEKGEAFRLVLDHSGRVRSSLATANHPWGSPETIVQTTEPMETDTWYHIAMGYDGSSSSIYINGKLAGTSGDVLSGQLLNNTQDLLIGASAETGWELLAGQVDDLILFREMLSDSSVQRLYNLYPLDTTSSRPVDTEIGTLGNEVLLFPNPAFDQVIIQGLPPHARISLYSLQGEQLYAEMQPGSTEHTLDVSVLPPGFYILRIRQGKQWISRKLLIAN